MRRRTARKFIPIKWGQWDTDVVEGRTIRVLSGHESTAPSYFDAILRVDIEEATNTGTPDSWHWFVYNTEDDSASLDSSVAVSLANAKAEVLKAYKTLLAKIPEDFYEGMLEGDVYSQSAPSSKKPSPKSAILDRLKANYPSIVELSMSLAPEESVFAWETISKSKKPEAELEKLAIYDTLTSNGPDVDASIIGKHLKKFQLAAAPILENYEDGFLFTMLDDAGWFGPKSDKLRGQERYYSFQRRRRAATRRVSRAPYLREVIEEALLNTAYRFAEVPSRRYDLAFEAEVAQDHASRAVRSVTEVIDNALVDMGYDCFSKAKGGGRLVECDAGWAKVSLKKRPGYYWKILVEVGD